MTTIKSYDYKCEKAIKDIDLNNISIPIEKHKDKKGNSLSIQERGKDISILDKIIYNDNGEDIELTEIQRLSSGEYGCVYKLSSSDGNISLALKYFYDEKDPEIETLKALETGNINCNILKAKAITLNIKNNNKKKTGFGRLLVKSKKTFILAELYDNDLSKLNMKNLDDHTKLEIFKQILDDIYCLFTKEFYYTDIKQENIFYKCISGGKIKVVLGDIGSIYKKRDGGFLNFFKPDMDALISVELSDEQNNIIRKNNITDYVILVQINMIIGIVKLGTFLKFNNNELNGKILYLNNITIINFDKAYTYLNQIINKILYTNLKSKYAHTSKNLPKNKERHNERHKILFI